MQYRDILCHRNLETLPFKFCPHVHDICVCEKSTLDTQQQRRVGLSTPPPPPHPSPLLPVPPLGYADSRQVCQQTRQIRSTPGIQTGRRTDRQTHTRADTQTGTQTDKHAFHRTAVNHGAVVTALVRPISYLLFL